MADIKSMRQIRERDAERVRLASEKSIRGGWTQDEKDRHDLLACLDEAERHIRSLLRGDADMQKVRRFLDG